MSTSNTRLQHPKGARSTQHRAPSVRHRARSTEHRTLHLPATSIRCIANTTVRSPPAIPSTWCGRTRDPAIGRSQGSAPRPWRSGASRASSTRSRRSWRSWGRALRRTCGGSIPQPRIRSCVRWCTGGRAASIWWRSCGSCGRCSTRMEVSRRSSRRGTRPIMKTSVRRSTASRRVRCRWTFARRTAACPGERGSATSFRGRPPAAPASGSICSCAGWSAMTRSTSACGAVYRLRSWSSLSIRTSSGWGAASA